MRLDLLNLVENQYIREDIPEFGAGDTLNVHVRIKEGDKERIQKFKGVVIQVKGSGLSKTFTIRKMSSGIGVERIFPLHSPNIAEIEVLRRGQVRRSRIYYFRKLKGKNAKIKELRKR